MTECDGVQWLPPMLGHMGGETRDTVLDCPVQEERVGSRVLRETVENPGKTWFLLLNTVKAKENQLNI